MPRVQESRNKLVSVVPEMSMLSLPSWDLAVVLASPATAKSSLSVSKEGNGAKRSLAHVYSGRAVENGAGDMWWSCRAHLV